MAVYEEEARFPPLISPIRLREIDDAFEAAKLNAAQEGAGSLFYVGRFMLIEFALVLEPEEPLKYARKVFYAGMNALADAMAAIAPPEKDISFDYPGVLFFDGALMGGGRLAWPDGTGEDDRPDWLIFSAMIRAGGMRDLGMGLGPEVTSLDDEGFEEWTASGFAASFSRHFLVEMDSWNERGFAGIGPRYLSRLEKEEGAKRRGIDSNGDLLIHHEGIEGAERVAFLPKLIAAEWYNAAEREPRG